MIFFRSIIISIFFVLIFQNAFSETESKTSAEVKEVKEEPLPLNDPFAGDASSASTLVSEAEPTTDAVKLRAYKLVGSFSGEDQSFITLVDESGEFMILELYEELVDGLKLVDINIKRAVFQQDQDDNFIIINFKNQIKEVNEY